jgi:hypothetical protein
MHAAASGTTLAATNEESRREASASDVTPCVLGQTEALQRRARRRARQPLDTRVSRHCTLQAEALPALEQIETDVVSSAQGLSQRF